ncbi:hypothetical protein YC2023_017161 [Brassica napus]
MEDESRRWFSSSILLIGGSCRRFFSSVALLADARWLPSTNLGGYCRRIKSVALPDDEKRRLLLIAIERLRLLFQIVRKTFVVSEGIKKEPKQVPGDILSFFTRKNFNGTDRGETITNNGFEERTSCSAHVLYMYKLLCSCSEVSDGCVRTVNLGENMSGRLTDEVTRVVEDSQTKSRDIVLCYGVCNVVWPDVGLYVFEGLLVKGGGYYKLCGSRYLKLDHGRRPSLT